MLTDLQQPANYWLADATQNFKDLLAENDDPSFVIEIGGAVIEVRLNEAPGVFSRKTIPSQISPLNAAPTHSTEERPSSPVISSTRGPEQHLVGEGVGESGGAVELRKYIERMLYEARRERELHRRVRCDHMECFAQGKVAALAEILTTLDATDTERSDLFKPMIDLTKLWNAMPPDVQRKISCHDLKRIVDNYNGLEKPETWWERSQYPHPKFPAGMRPEILPDVIWLRFHRVFRGSFVNDVTGWQSTEPMRSDPTNDELDHS